MRARFDVLSFADPRFMGGTTRAVLAEMEAARQADFRLGLCPMLGAAFAGPRRWNAGLADALRAGRAQLIDASAPVEAGAVLIHHPSLFVELPARTLDVRTGCVALVLHHPPFSASEAAQYPLETVVANISECFGQEVFLAPVGPAVRVQLEAWSLPGARLLPFDWSNLFDPADWPFRGVAAPSRRNGGRGRIVIGRHSRDDGAKFPEQRSKALAVYPEAEDIEVRFLGAGSGTLAALAPLPSNWSLHPFGSRDVAGFLRELDLFVYFHSDDWIEAFGYAVVEAMAVGVPVIVPEQFRSLFGDAAVYAEPEGVRAEIDSLMSNPGRYAGQAARARAFVTERFGLDRFRPRLDELVGLTERRAPPSDTVPAAPARPRRIAFVTSNGVGLGHLTRTMAVASRLSAGSAAAFFTLSRSFGLAIKAGFRVQYVPHYRSTGASRDEWNAALSGEFADFLCAFCPDAVVFDGNVPYPGLIAALDIAPAVGRVWLRRGLWNAAHDKPMDDEARFDLVIEPAELSARFDRGSTAGNPWTQVVAPVLHTRPGERLLPAAARAELELPPDATVIAIALGSGANFDLSGMRRRLLADLRDRPDVETIEIVSPLARQAPAESARQVALYPAFRHSAAFDGVISGAGYNAFHEAIFGGIPTIFVPNEAAEMDLQVVRAQHAARTGAGLLLRVYDEIGAADAVTRLLSPETRDTMRRRMRWMVERSGYGARDGAAETARHVEALATAVPANRPMR